MDTNCLVLHAILLVFQSLKFYEPAGYNSIEPIVLRRAILFSSTTYIYSSEGTDIHTLFLLRPIVVPVGLSEDIEVHLPICLSGKLICKHQFCLELGILTDPFERIVHTNNLL